MKIDEFDIVETCSACPEQYEIYTENKLVGTMRLRHGLFTAQLFDCEEYVYQASPNGDGCFSTDERDYFLKEAINSVRLALNRENSLN